MASTRRPSSAPRSRLRLIGGALRGRHIEFTEEPGLRPTPDRVRETLFNWLQPLVTGSHCLDLFAGSGALGFEALSRGASSVTLVEQSGTAGVRAGRRGRTRRPATKTPWENTHHTPLLPRRARTRMIQMSQKKSKW